MAFDVGSRSPPLSSFPVQDTTFRSVFQNGRAWSYDGFQGLASRSSAFLTSPSNNITNTAVPPSLTGWLFSEVLALIFFSPTAFLSNAMYWPNINSCILKEQLFTLDSTFPLFSRLEVSIAYSPFLSGYSTSNTNTC